MKRYSTYCVAIEREDITGGYWIHDKYALNTGKMYNDT